MSDEPPADRIKELERERARDPLSSALACILARSTRNRITIERIERNPAEKTTRITFKMEQ